MTNGDLRRLIKDKPWDQEVEGLSCFAIDLGSLTIKPRMSAYQRGGLLVDQDFEITINGKRIEMNPGIIGVHLGKILRNELVGFSLEYESQTRGERP